MQALRQYDFDLSAVFKDGTMVSQWWVLFCKFFLLLLERHCRRYFKWAFSLRMSCSIHNVTLCLNNADCDIYLSSSENLFYLWVLSFYVTVDNNRHSTEHACMPIPLAPDPIRVQPCVCCLFWTNRNCMAVSTIFLSILSSNLRWNH